MRWRANPLIFWGGELCPVWKNVGMTVMSVLHNNINSGILDRSSSSECVRDTETGV